MPSLVSADVRLADCNGNTALYYAVFLEIINTDTLKFLIDSRANVGHRNNKGKTVLNFLSQRDDKYGCDAMKILLSNGAKTSEEDEKNSFVKKILEKKSESKIMREIESSSFLPSIYRPIKCSHEGQSSTEACAGAGARCDDTAKDNTRPARR